LTASSAYQSHSVVARIADIAAAGIKGVAVETPLLEPKNGQLAACHYPLEKWPMTDDEIRQAEGAKRYAHAATGIAASSAELPDDV